VGEAERAVIAQWDGTAAEAMAAMDPEGDFIKRHVLNPVVLGLLGDVTGRRVLDAGSGQGYFSRMLASRGAHVTAVEPAGALFRYAAAREAELGQGIRLIQADLTEISFQPVYDAVVANMVLLSIPDWEAALRTCVGALRPGSLLVFSIDHPCFENAAGHWAETGAVLVQEYLAEYPMERPQATDFHRPLATYLNAVIRTGCRITEVVEPGLPAELVDAPGVGRGAAGLVHVPNFLVIAAQR